MIDYDDSPWTDEERELLAADVDAMLADDMAIEDALMQYSTRMPSFQSYFAPASPAEIAAAEKRLGVTLPEDYRVFLRTVNGGVPMPNCFTVPGQGGVMLGALYGIAPERRSLDLDYELENAAMWNPLPPGLLAIGCDPGGNQVMLSMRQQDTGGVYFWERVGFWIQKDGQNLFPLAPSFAAFLEMLWANPECP